MRSYFKEADKFYLWFTNLTPEQLNANDIMMLYRCRWQIELLFKELKSYTCWRKFNTGQKPIVDGFIWISLLSLILRRSISMQIMPKVSHFKAAKNQDIWFLPIFRFCILQSWEELSAHLDWVRVYFDKNVKKSQQRKSIQHKTLDGIMGQFSA